MKGKVTAGDKFKKSVHDLERALRFEDKALQDSFYYAGLSKSFEVCLEYAWKELRRRLLDQGLEPMSPLEAIKMAGRINLIDSVEVWMQFLKDRNAAVHNYGAISQEDYLKTMHRFLPEVKKILQNRPA